jgi:hypothetical protein
MNLLLRLELLLTWCLGTACAFVSDVFELAEDLCRLHFDTVEREVNEAAKEEEP